MASTRRMRRRPAEMAMDKMVIERLGNPDCYPGNPGEVRIYQTHLSVVCVAGDFAYKLKKPLKLTFVDFSTAALREYYCREEVRLNRRLCPDVYLGVMPLFAGSDGVTFRNDAGGEVIDQAVHMRRLPQDRMLDEMLERDAVQAADVEAIAGIMARFHAAADRGPEVREAGSPAHLEKFALENFSETRTQIGAVFDPELHGLLEERTRKDFDRLRPALEARVAEGRVVEGHGDLHARNICLCDPIAIYDCIEFSAGFRCEDVATENAFLVMDLLYRGHRELARAYLDAYIAESGDAGQRALVPALVRYRAMVRAKVSAIVAGETEISAPDREGALASAKKHLHLCAASAVAEDGPLLVLACGLPATGKTTVLEELSRETGWPCLASDRVRKELAEVAADEKLPENFYSEAFSRRTYDELARRGVRCLDTSPVLLDANFRSQELRKRVADVARNAGARVVVVWFRVEDAVVERRMRAREEAQKGVSDADLAVYGKLKAAFEEPSAEEGLEVVVVDGGAERGEVIARILCGLVGGGDGRLKMED